MVQITGNYQHEKNENIDDYFRAIGVPYIGRKMMAMSSPSMEISESENVWSIKTSSLMRTNESKFKLNEEYDESMPGGLLKTTTVLDGDKLTSTSVADEGTKIVRTYEFTDSHCIIIGYSRGSPYDRAASEHCLSFCLQLTDKRFYHMRKVDKLLSDILNVYK